MIDRAAIMAWNEQAPWTEPAMVEQDLIICKALVCIFSDEFLARNLAFRGGTALHKLYLQPQVRYSEDIDLVQINPGPIKPIMFRLGEVLSWMPDKVTKQKKYNNTMLFRMESEIPPVQPIRLKVEINCFEHFNVLGLHKVPFSVDNPWFKGQCELTTYALDELIVPGFQFRLVDLLVTNFHQPESTLILLVSAFVKGDWRTIYDYALGHGFRFLSYGDSSLLERR